MKDSIIKRICSNSAGSLCLPSARVGTRSLASTLGVSWPDIESTQELSLGTLYRFHGICGTGGRLRLLTSAPLESLNLNRLEPRLSCRSIESKRFWMQGHLVIRLYRF